MRRLRRPRVDTKVGLGEALLGAGFLLIAYALPPELVPKLIAGILGVGLLLAGIWTLSRRESEAEKTPPQRPKVAEPVPWAGQIASETGGHHEVSDPILPPAHAANAETARGVGKAFSPAIGISDALQAQITRGPSNPGIHEVNWKTEGKRNVIVHLSFRPRALRFFSPLDQTITASDLPATIPIGAGRVIVTRFFDAGFMVDEIDTAGDVVRVQPYRDPDGDQHETGGPIT